MFLLNAVWKARLDDECTCSVCFFMNLAIINTSVLGVFLALREREKKKKKKMPATVSSASQSDSQRAEDKTKGIKMCQMNPSVRGGFQGSCGGVLCRSA